MAVRRPFVNTNKLKNDPNNSDWMDDPKIPCKGLTGMFFAPNRYRDDGEPTVLDPDWDMKPRGICYTCPHQRPCFEWAMQEKGVEGIWGGSNESQREHIRRKRRDIRAAILCPECESPDTGPIRKTNMDDRMCVACGHRFQYIGGHTPYIVTKDGNRVPIPKAT